ncbi:MAG: DUF5618 family protein [Chitinispirillales bacterium]|nr:DUF5618 family protein [Chitinispirillales bacterium]
MTREEQDSVLSVEYAESNRYMDNAKETLRKAEKQDDGYYRDDKYVRTACGTAYLGVLRALETWLVLKGIEIPDKKKRKSIEFYEYSVAQIDKKMLSHLKAAYSVLHLDGYYRGVTRVKIIEGGFDAAYEIIDKIKPENPVDVPETRGGKAKRAWNALLISAAVMFMRNRF